MTHGQPDLATRSIRYRTDAGRLLERLVRAGLVPTEGARPRAGPEDRPRYPCGCPAPHLLVCLSGRGDKGLEQVRMRLGSSFRE
ncbi:hypothetical protein [Actinomyces mediterranea]|uniref:hypothetical protein n=1 Tax=Actinomyces mediterranea TaxID=1871028 RepID=UPI00101ADE79|nr:hypothetical protein [Actinomyces mediterranea]